MNIIERLKLYVNANIEINYEEKSSEILKSILQNLRILNIYSMLGKLKRNRTNVKAQDNLKK